MIKNFYYPELACRSCADLANFLRNTPTLQHLRLSKSDKARRGSFQLDRKTVAHRIVDAIAKQHSQEVGWNGRNNVHYTRVCTPSGRNIDLRDFKRVYVPQWSISYFAFSKGYRITVIEKPQELFLLENSLAICRICNEPIQEEILLCNSCGNTTHKGKSHGYECRSCGKTMCRNCTHWTRRRVFFKRYLCEGCALEEQKLQKTTRKLVSDQPTKQCIDCDRAMAIDAVRCMKCSAFQPDKEQGNDWATQFKDESNLWAEEDQDRASLEQSGRKWETAKRVLKATATVIMFLLIIINLIPTRRRSKRLF